MNDFIHKTAKFNPFLSNRSNLILIHFDFLKKTVGTGGPLGVTSVKWLAWREKDTD